MSTDHEDDPPLSPPPSHPGFSDPDETTKPDLRSPILPPRKTLSPEDANQVMVRKALVDSANATEALTRLLPSLATKDDLTTYDAGLRMVLAELQDLRREQRQQFSDIKLWLFGSETQRGIVKDLELARHGIDSALAAATKAGQEIGVVKKLTITIYNGVIHGADAITSEERKALEAL